MTTATKTARLRRGDEDWADYIEYVTDLYTVEEVKREDYDNFNGYYSALMAQKADVGVKGAVNILRALVASLRVTDCPELHELRIQYYGSGDSGEIVEIETNREQQGPRPGLADVILHEFDSDLRTALDDAGWSLAYNLNPGFEISDGVYDGGDGSICVTYDKLTNEWSVTVDHNQRIMENNSSSYSFA